MAVATFVSKRRRPVARSSHASRPSAVAATTQAPVSTGEATTGPSGTVQRRVSRVAFGGPGRAPLLSGPPRKVVQAEEEAGAARSALSSASAAAAADAKRASGEEETRPRRAALRARVPSSTGGGPSSHQDTSGGVGPRRECSSAPTSKTADAASPSPLPSSRGRPSTTAIVFGSIGGKRGGVSPCARASSRRRSRPSARAGSSGRGEVKCLVALRRWSSSVSSGMPAWIISTSLLPAFRDGLVERARQEAQLGPGPRALEGGVDRTWGAGVGGAGHGLEKRFGKAEGLGDPSAQLEAAHPLRSAEVEDPGPLAAQERGQGLRRGFRVERVPELVPVEADGPARPQGPQDRLAPRAARSVSAADHEGQPDHRRLRVGGGRRLFSLPLRPAVDHEGAGRLRLGGPGAVPAQDLVGGHRDEPHPPRPAEGGELAGGGHVEGEGVVRAPLTGVGAPEGRGMEDRVRSDGLEGGLDGSARHEVERNGVQPSRGLAQMLTRHHLETLAGQQRANASSHEAGRAGQEDAQGLTSRGRPRRVSPTMKFPGSRLLHQWDLSVHRLSLDDLVRSCRETGLTGLAELKLPGAAGVIFYYAGIEVNAHYREGAENLSGGEALERLQAKVGGPVGTILVYELPLDMAHLLRGIIKRNKIEDTLRSPADLEELLRRLQAAEHTGTLEISNRKGSAMILFVRGRASNF